MAAVLPKPDWQKGDLLLASLEVAQSASRLKDVTLACFALSRGDKAIVRPLDPASQKQGRPTTVPQTALQAISPALLPVVNRRSRLDVSLLSTEELTEADTALVAQLAQAHKVASLLCGRSLLHTPAGNKKDTALSEFCRIVARQARVAERPQ
ncbi:MAG: hypothetical protein MHM6MM_008937, partial [Cercozoa sp. M6MM]